MRRSFRKAQTDGEACFLDDSRQVKPPKEEECTHILDKGVFK
jgi:hypothetical protein